MRRGAEQLLGVGDISKAALAVRGFHFQSVTICHGFISFLFEALFHFTPINCYFGKEEARIYHIVKSDDSSQIIEVGCGNEMHSVLVMDSDKKNSKSDINTTKKRIKEELENNGFLCWVTDGREIENYISEETVNAAYGLNLKQAKKYDSFSNHLEKNGIKYGNNKAKEAARILEHINKDNCEKMLDLNQKIKELYEQIGKWKQE